jgi:hypothetical protein
VRRSLADWLTDMGLISAGRTAETDGYVGYMEPYATGHQALDRDQVFQQETTNVARALGTPSSSRAPGSWKTPPPSSKANASGRLSKAHREH